MISIQQDKCNLDRTNLVLSKLSGSTVLVNVEMIEADLSRLKSMEKSAFNKYDKRNIAYIKKELYRIAENIDLDNPVITLDFHFDMSKYRIVSEPVEFNHYNIYNIKTTDYIVSGKNKIMHIDYSNVFKIILFEMMYREFGYTLKSMEEILKHIGIVTVVSDSEIMSCIPENIVNLSKSMSITDSPYATVDHKMAWDYFSHISLDESVKAFTSGYYRDCTTRSINLANTIIVRDMAEALEKSNIDFGIISVNEDGLYISINNEDEDIVKENIDSISVRAFGRKFEVKPKIKVY